MKKYISLLAITVLGVIFSGSVSAYTTYSNQYNTYTSNSAYYTNSYNYQYTVQCGNNEYRDGNTCRTCTKPSNSGFTSHDGCAWKCNSGYTLSNGSCARTTYVQPTYQQVNTYSTGYQYGYYREPLVECGLGKYRTSENTCRTCDRPSNSSYINDGRTCSWACNSGYTAKNGTCERNITCSSSQYQSGNSCYNCTKPHNSYYNGNGKTCSWKCDSGYTQSGNSCVKTYTNTISQYQYPTYTQYNTQESCIKPYHSYFTNNGCAWQCVSGYYRSGGACLENSQYRTTTPYYYNGSGHGYNNPIQYYYDPSYYYNY